SGACFVHSHAASFFGVGSLPSGSALPDGHRSESLRPSSGGADLPPEERTSPKNQPPCILQLHVLHPPWAARLECADQERSDQAVAGTGVVAPFVGLHRRRQVLVLVAQGER